MSTEISLPIPTGLRIPTGSELVARVNEGMVEQQRIAAFFGKRNTQTTLKLMSLTMLAAGPYRQLRQCAAEIETRRAAFEENVFRVRRTRLKVARARAKAEALLGDTDPARSVQRDLWLLHAEECEQQVRASLVYLEGCYKEIGSLIDAYNQIRATHGIPERWDEADMERGEIEGHLKALFRLSYRTFRETGRVSRSALEYGEQFGIHPDTLCLRVEQYHADCRRLVSEGRAPTIEHLHDWLHACYEAHCNDVKRAVAHLGLVELITRWSLYVEPEGD